MAPTPAAASKLRRATLRAALIRAGRRRNIDHQVERILAGLRAEQFRQPELIEQAMGQAALAHLRALDAAVANVVELEHALGEAFAQHPDAAIITSFPGLGTVLGRADPRRDRRRPHPIRRRQSPQGVRRDRAGHPRVGQEDAR